MGKEQIRCLLANLLDKFSECRFYQGDEEPCLLDCNHLACNCCGEIKDCDANFQKKTERMGYVGETERKRKDLYECVSNLNLGGKL